MTDQPNPRRARLRTAVLVVVLLLVIAAVAVAGALTGGAATRPAATGTPPAAPTAARTTGAAPTKPTPTRTGKAPSKPAASGRPTPQPTRTAAIASAAPIVKALTAKVMKLEAVQGKANGPGEIAGPAVRFTIAITNTTGKRIDLSSTVVNAYSGKDSTPALQLQSPGGKAFPAAVADGRTATGVFVFTIPKADRGRVEVTVDTSVRNPVVAFRGSAPR